MNNKFVSWGKTPDGKPCVIAVEAFTHLAWLRRAEAYGKLKREQRLAKRTK